MRLPASMLLACGLCGVVAMEQQPARADDTPAKVLEVEVKRPATAEDLRGLLRGRESSPDELRAIAGALASAYGDETPPEAVRMFIAIARDQSQLGPGEGWFGPAQSRYSWEWLAKRNGIEPDKRITPETFQGSKEQFRRLDRNRDGEIGADDFDWSDGNAWVRQAAMANRLFRKLDRDGDGRLTRENLLDFFDRIRGDREEIRAADLRDALIGGPSGFTPGDAPQPEALIRGLLKGEIGSLEEGPDVGTVAPDFALQTQDGKQSIRLSEQLGKQPVVLCFGNFTCGPFRSLYPQVDELHDRYRNDATFLLVYVREAHPTDGWVMQSNAQAGVVFRQPQTYPERVAIAQTCQMRLKPSLPLLVDDIDDTVGNSYSGMPARLYVIGADGKVVYKSGRGPFGFKTGEMEQSLVMHLLETGYE